MGWQDTAMEPGVMGPLVTFETRGSHTIRSQARDDCASIESIRAVALSGMSRITGSAEERRHDSHSALTDHGGIRSFAPKLSRADRLEAASVSRCNRRREGPRCRARCDRQQTFQESVVATSKSWLPRKRESRTHRQAQREPGPRELPDPAAHQPHQVGPRAAERHSESSISRRRCETPSVNTP